MSVKYLHSGMAGAPQVNGTAGSLKAVLDACLVTGWGLAAIDSLVILGGVATANVIAGHPYEAGSTALLAGVVTSGGSVNGEQRVLSVTNNSFSFATTLVNQTASTPGTHKVAPLGWQSPAGYQSGNIVAYHSVDAAGTQAWLRLDDTVAQQPRVRGYLDMSDHSTGTGPFPMTSQVAGSGLWWATSSEANSGSRQWIVIGDGRTFYWCVAPQTGSNINNYAVFVFGDFASNLPVDPGAAIISGGTSTQTAPTDNVDVFHTNSLDLISTYLAGPASALGGAVPTRKSPLHSPLNFFLSPAQLFSWSGQGDNDRFFTYPNPAGGGLVLSPVLLVEPIGTNIGPRGRLRGVYFAPQRIGNGAIASRTPVSDSGLPSRVLRAVCSHTGVGFIDSTGPWQ